MDRSLALAASIDTHATPIKTHAARPVYQKRASIMNTTPSASANLRRRRYMIGPVDPANLRPKIGSSRTRRRPFFSVSAARDGFGSPHPHGRAAADLPTPQNGSYISETGQSWSYSGPLVSVERLIIVSGRLFLQ